MRAEDLRGRLRRRPFRPFRIHLSDQSAFDIRHPDGAIVGSTAIVLPVPGDDAPAAVAEDGIAVSLTHITRVEPLKSAPAPGLN